MTTKEAIQTMLDGYKLTAETWGVHEFIYFDGECFIEENYTPIPLNDISGMSGILKIYEEPKPKQTVTIEKWLLKMQGTNQYAIEEGSKEEMCTWGKNKIDAWQKVKLLDTYEVEL